MNSEFRQAVTYGTRMKIERTHLGKVVHNFLFHGDEASCLVEGSFAPTGQQDFLLSNFF